MSLQDRLHDLFLLDQQLRGISARLNASNNRLKNRKNKQEQLERQRAEADEQLKHLQASAVTLEHEAADMDLRIDKLRTQMNSVKSNKEYSALLVEVNTLKVDKSKLEDETLNELTEVDAAKERIAEVGKKIEERARLVALAESEVATARDEVGTRIDDLTVKRDAASADVPGEILAQFNRLADHHDGEALAAVQEQDRRRREYICGGCFLALPVEHLNALMTRPEDLITCTSCGRILFVGTALKDAISTR